MFLFNNFEIDDRINLKYVSLPDRTTIFSFYNCYRFLVASTYLSSCNMIRYTLFLIQ